MVSYQFQPYVSASKPCSEKCQPGARALLATVLKKYPFAYSLGCYNCRTTRGSSKISQHAKGRAIDIGVKPLSGGRRDPKGDEIARKLLEHADELGIMFLKWGAKGDYDPNGGAGQWSARQHTGNPVGDSLHYNHIHVDLHPTYAARLNLSAVQSILADEPREYAQAVVGYSNVDLSSRHGRKIAERYRLGLLRVDDKGVLHSVSHPGNKAVVGDFAVIVGGGAAKRFQGSPSAGKIVLAGATRDETETLVNEFCADNPPDDWKRSGNPFD